MKSKGPPIEASRSARYLRYLTKLYPGKQRSQARAARVCILKSNSGRILKENVRHAYEGSGNK